MVAPTPAGIALLQTFEAIRIINLSSRKDRRRQIEAEFAGIGLSVGNGQIQLFEAISFDTPGSCYSPGARGCFHSHLAVLEEALRKKFSSVLIIEDDFDFSKDIDEKLPAATEALKKSDWAVFYGGHDYLAKPDRCGAIAPMGDAWAKGTHFIAFQADCIDLLVEHLRSLEVQQTSQMGARNGVDGAYKSFRAAYPAFKSFAAWPKLGYQRPSSTNVAQLSAADRILPSGLVQMVRTIKRASIRART